MSTETKTNGRHGCYYPSRLPPFGGWGHAIDNGCEEDERGFFWVGNDEYASPVDFCPFCGTRAPRPAAETDAYRSRDGRSGAYVSPAEEETT